MADDVALVSQSGPAEPRPDTTNAPTPEFPKHSEAQETTGIALFKWIMTDLVLNCLLPQSILFFSLSSLHGWRGVFERGDVMAVAVGLLATEGSKLLYRHPVIGRKAAHLILAMSSTLTACTAILVMANANYAARNPAEKVAVTVYALDAFGNITGEARAQIPPPFPLLDAVGTTAPCVATFTLCLALVLLSIYLRTSARRAK